MSISTKLYQQPHGDTTKESLVGRWFFKHEHCFGEVMGQEGRHYVVRVPSYARYDTCTYVHPEEVRRYYDHGFQRRGMV